MTTSAMHAATNPTTNVWCGPLETEQTFEAKPSADLPVGMLLSRLAEATAAADAHRREGGVNEGRPAGQYVADPIRVRTLRPVAGGRPLRARARIVGVADGMTVVACTLWSEGFPVAEATVVARREPAIAGAALQHVVRPPVQTLGGWSAATVAPSPLQQAA